MSDRAPEIVGGEAVVLYSRLEHERGQNPPKLDLPYGLAICRIQKGGYYLFTCHDHWMAKFDSWHATLDEAKEQAEHEFPGVADTWKSS
jgi:hypothetical protein